MSIRRKFQLTLLSIGILVILAGVVAWPKGPDLDLRKIGIPYIQELKIHKGLDLQGGTHLVYESDLSKVKGEDQDKAMEGLVESIDRRVNAFGVGEPLIYQTKSGDKRRLTAELPGISNVNEAINLIGKTAQLEFKVQDPSGQGFTSWSPPLNGSYLQRADIKSNSQSGEIEVNIQFNGEGAKIFGEITRQNVSKPVAIYLDDQQISSPVVQTEIQDGNAVITGNFTKDTAKTLATQLNAGALPVPINLVEQRTVGPTLGQEAVAKSLAAGILGIAVVIFFMIFYYRLPGLLASVALGGYTLFILAIFKGALVLIPPITLTLAGVAGVVLSIGMAVDANILIFERMKEELRAGKSLSGAINDGVRRAWTSIRDSNVSTIITSLILYQFGSGLVRGFALTLIIGVLVSMFTAIVVTKSLLRLFVNTRFAKNPKLFGVEEIKGI